ncbi:hypothetical protein, partial [Parasulfitobacter algicola]|uniref:hypothetical protein n=1 Tax=Parasulfitobacter algicola TaxID=2614809 RepID=UPI001C2D29A7
QRKSALTGRAAAYRPVGERQVWAVLAEATRSVAWTFCNRSNDREEPLLTDAAQSSDDSNCAKRLFISVYRKI